MLAAIGHAQHCRMWCRVVGCGQQALSIKKHNQQCNEAVEGFIKIRGKIYQFNNRSELESLLK